jgi:hypothetical protein
MLRKSFSRVAGLSGGSISRAGGGTASFTRGHGTGPGVAQPPSKLAPATIGSAQFRIEVTLYPLSALNLAPVCLM